ncbi:hypothetical protein Moror_2062, partial [Moniliophthora roreri MCA 2997]
GEFISSRVFYRGGESGPSAEHVSRTPNTIETTWLNFSLLALDFHVPFLSRALFSASATSGRLKQTQKIQPRALERRVLRVKIDAIVNERTLCAGITDQ